MKVSLLAPLVLLGACQLGPTDVPLGFHVTSGAAGSGSAGGAGAGSAGDTCTLVSSQGPVSYAAGEIARLDGTLLLSAKRSGKCARTLDCSLEPEVVEQATCSAQRCQLWHALEVESGWFVLGNLQNGGCLDVGNGSMAARATIQAFACHARANQRWQAVCAGGDGWRITNQNSGLLLGVDGPNDGDSVLQYSDSTVDPQLWQISQQPDAYAELVPTSEQVGQSWRFTTQLPADGWQNAMFDDGAWTDGLAAFGTRYELPWAPRTEWNSEQLWLRRSFLLESVPPELDLRVFHNGPIEVYINGVLAYQGDSSIGYRVAPLGPLPALAPSVSYLAVHCAKNADQSFGPYFDLGLGRLLWR